MNDRILICIPYRDRKAIVERCVPTVAAGMADYDCLQLYNDGSAESGDAIDAEWRRLIPGVCCYTTNGIGIEAMRRRHFMEFTQRPFTHLYLADSDAPHDPNWRFALLALQKKYGGLPVCGYDTVAHSSLPANTISETDDAILRRVAPGISYLLTAEHVANVVAWLEKNSTEHWRWDWTVPALLDHKFVVSKPSYVDHIGHGGLHHPAGAGLDEGDRATNPTTWLVQKRAEIVAELRGMA